jgi:hypothetical protein
MPSRKVQQAAATAVSQRTNLLASPNAAPQNLRQAWVDEWFTMCVLIGELKDELP